MAQSSDGLIKWAMIGLAAYVVYEYFQSSASGTGASGAGTVGATGTGNPLSSITNAISNLFSSAPSSASSVTTAPAVLPPSSATATPAATSITAVNTTASNPLVSSMLSTQAAPSTAAAPMSNAALTASLPTTQAYMTPLNESVQQFEITHGGLRPMSLNQWIGYAQTMQPGTTAAQAQMTYQGDVVHNPNE